VAGTGTDEVLGAGELLLGAGPLVELRGGATEVESGGAGVLGRVGGELGVLVRVGVGGRDGLGEFGADGTEVAGAGAGERPPGMFAPEPEAGRTRKYTAIETAKTAPSTIVEGRTATCARHQSRMDALAVGVQRGGDGDALAQHGAGDAGAQRPSDVELFAG
jgi:hypothetical protein